MFWVESDPACFDLRAKFNADDEYCSTLENLLRTVSTTNSERTKISGSVGRNFSDLEFIRDSKEMKVISLGFSSSKAFTAKEFIENLIAS